jgi:hypothetical protein
LSTSRNDGVTINTDLSSLASDVYVVSGVYNISTGIVTYTNSTGGTFQVSGFTTGMTDSYTTAANLNGETIEFDNNIQGGNLYSVNLSPVLSGKTDLTLFDAHTGDTNNPHQTTFGNLISTAHTHTISDVTNLQTELDSKIQNGINSGGGNEVFSGKSGTDLYFRTLSGGTNTTITTIGDIINIDVTTSNMPQAQKLYVDSENGTDVTTSGELGQPFLTPEYALNQIDNTGIITGDTNSNTTISGISDIDNDKLEVGMYLYGLGVLFGSVIVSKGNEGSDSNTITISKNVSSSNTNVSINFIKIYELVLNGTFNVSSRTLFKEGVWIRNNGLVNYSTFNLFNLGTAVLNAPYKILGKGNYNGLDTSARFISTGQNQPAGFTLDIEFGNIYTVYTGPSISINLGTATSHININGNFVDARFGTVGSFVASYIYVNFNSYGLLGGISFSTSNGSSALYGRHETPSAVSVFNSGYRTYSRADLYGSTTWVGQSSHNGYLGGSTHTFGGVNVNSSGGGGTITVTAGSNTITAVSSYTVNVNQNYSLNTYGTGKYTFAAISGTLNNYGVTSNSSSLTGNNNGVINNYGYFYVVSMGSFTGTFNNFGEVVAGSFGGGADVNNFGKVRMIYYGIGVAANKKFTNRGYINSTGSLLNSNAIVTLANANSVFENYGQIENSSTDVTKTVIEKKLGTLHLRQGSYLKVGNSLSPIKVPIVDSGTTTSTTAFKLIQSGQNFASTVFVGAKVYNTTDNTEATVIAIDSNIQLSLDVDIMTSGKTFIITGNPDVNYFGVTTNCDGTTYGLTFAFNGSSIAPNDLAGGTLFENTNY